MISFHYSIILYNDYYINIDYGYYLFLVLLIVLILIVVGSFMYIDIRFRVYCVIYYELYSIILNTIILFLLLVPDNNSILYYMELFTKIVF